MTDFTCPFCGSKELRVKSGYIELKKNGEYGAIEDFCCLAQKKNHQYVVSKYLPDDDNRPDPEEVSKW